MRQYLPGPHRCCAGNNPAGSGTGKTASHAGCLSNALATALPCEAMRQDLFCALAQLPGLAAPAHEWRSRLSADAYHHALPLLRNSGRSATTMPCPDGCGCDHEVVDVGAPVAVCTCEKEGGCPDIEVQPGELEIYEANVEKIGREIARAVNCRPVHADIGSGEMWQVGAWSASGVPVLMTFQSEGVGLAIRECAAQLGGSYVLLVPDPCMANATAREMLRGAALFGLRQILRNSAPGRFQPVKPPEELFAAFTSGLPDVEGERSTARAAFALIEKLDLNSPGRPPGLVTVFKLYCMDELPAHEIARKCGCSKTTVLERLARIRKETGIEPLQFRRASGHIDKLAERLTDSRATTVCRKFAAD